MRLDPKFASLRDEARSLAARNQEPRRAWYELNSWSFGKGPTAMKAAIMGFLDQHGSRPESAAILPEIARAASQLSPMDRSAMLSLANRSFSMVGFGRSILNMPSHNVSMRKDRPALSLVFHPKQPQKSGGMNIASAPLVQAPDLAEMMEARDRIFHVNDRIKESASIPKPSAHQADAQVKSASVTSESFKPMLKAVDGHVLVRSLIARVRSHSSDSPYMASSPAPKAVRTRKPARNAVKAVKRSVKAPKRKSAVRRARPKARKSRRK